MAKPLYTTAEAAVELGVTAGRVRQMILDGELAAEKLGRDLVIKAEALTTARQRKTKPGPTSAKQLAKTARAKKR